MYRFIVTVIDSRFNLGPVTVGLSVLFTQINIHFNKIWKMNNNMQPIQTNSVVQT